jgi:hypothetical protein
MLKAIRMLQPVHNLSVRRLCEDECSRPLAGRLRPARDDSSETTIRSHSYSLTPAQKRAHIAQLKKNSTAFVAGIVTVWTFSRMMALKPLHTARMSQVSREILGDFRPNSNPNQGLPYRLLCETLNGLELAWFSAGSANAHFKKQNYCPSSSSHWDASHDSFLRYIHPECLEILLTD